MSLQIGQKLYGYCGGYFSRDHYDDCRIEAIGYDWVVVRNENGSVDFAEGIHVLKFLEEKCLVKIAEE